MTEELEKLRRKRRLKLEELEYRHSQIIADSSEPEQSKELEELEELEDLHHQFCAHRFEPKELKEFENLHRQYFAERSETKEPKESRRKRRRKLEDLKERLRQRVDDSAERRHQGELEHDRKKAETVSLYAMLPPSYLLYGKCILVPQYWNLARHDEIHFDAYLRMPQPQDLPNADDFDLMTFPMQTLSAIKTGNDIKPWSFPNWDGTRTPLTAAQIHATIEPSFIPLPVERFVDTVHAMLQVLAQLPDDTQTVVVPYLLSSNQIQVLRVLSSQAVQPSIPWRVSPKLLRSRLELITF